MQGVDDIFREGPPCLAELSKLTKEEGFDGQEIDSFYSHHVFVKLKYEENQGRCGYGCTR